jgi:glyoxylase-like metal-dependent hydrolase (beta-lactamase superfamily II)
MPSETLAMVVNTHHHSDHVGGNHALQARHGTPVAAHALEAGAVNRGIPEACDSLWLRQDVAPYTVHRMLHDGDVLETGRTAWQVVHTPGHTAGHVSLFAPETGELVVGDVAHADDVAWIAPCHDGADALDRLLASIQRLASLRARIAFSGHGPPIIDPGATWSSARDRLMRWRGDPTRYAWHACKRIFAHALILTGGLPEADLKPYLLGCPWFCDHARLSFSQAPATFVAPLVAEMLRAGAAHWQGGCLVAAAALPLTSDEPADAQDSDRR